MGSINRIFEMSLSLIVTRYPILNDEVTYFSYWHLIVLQVQGIPQRKSPRPDAEWAEPFYVYQCDHLDLEAFTCEEFCGTCCGNLSNYKNPDKLRDHCCPGP